MVILHFVGCFVRIHNPFMHFWHFKFKIPKVIFKQGIFKLDVNTTDNIDNNLILVLEMQTDKNGQQCFSTKFSIDETSSEY